MPEEPDTFVEINQHGHWVRGFALVNLDTERSVNTFFDRSNAERKKSTLAAAWPEYSEDALEIVEVFVNVE